ncbi:IclR family transcriptional regulator [Pararoseomonas indoligenes]|uniref:Helix-turn-helix domain-containing protein n=1 Tax=Roseomonas indoligenes TaxID=2820811 RepID=A0A940MSQ4_9PROT|nr:helix-turn-helix domain-containing protein [Pararoseomonas indoligenes]MBP0493398.1 helix-turn-helix domain-containing protein [Pararoseomonas indoligenes]
MEPNVLTVDAVAVRADAPVIQAGRGTGPERTAERPAPPRARLLSPPSTASGVAAVGRAMTVLGAFRPGDTALPLRVLAARTGLYKSTILRLLASLERHCCVKRNADGSWSPGPMLLHWGSLYTRSLGLEALVPPVLDSLTEATGHGAAFWVRTDDERRICLYRSAPPRTLRVAVQAGDMMPLGGAATGRVFATWDPGMGEEAEPAPAVAPGGHPVVATQGSRDIDPAAVSAPVFQPGGALCGALTISGASERLWPEAERVKGLVAEAAAGLTRGLMG